MTPEEQIAQLEAALALERAKVHELSAALAVAVQRTAEADAARARKEETEANAKALRRERNRRYRDALKTEARRAQDVSVASSETSQAPSPSLPPPSSSPSLSAPISPPPISSPNPSSPPSASQGTASPSPGFELTSPNSKKRSRKPSAAEAMFTTIQATRKQRCEDVGEPFVAEEWPAQRQNRDLKPILAAENGLQARFEAAWGLYLADDGQRARTPAWSFAFFMSSGVRAKYETMAAREEAE